MFEESFISGFASGLEKAAKKKEKKKESTYGSAAGKGAMVLGGLGAVGGGLAGALHEGIKYRRSSKSRPYGSVGREKPSAGTRLGRGIAGAGIGGLSGAAQGALFGLLAHHVTKKD